MLKITVSLQNIGTEIDILCCHFMKTIFYKNLFKVYLFIYSGSRLIEIWISPALDPPQPTL
jgi:hypothetical protein